MRSGLSDRFEFKFKSLLSITCLPFILTFTILSVAGAESIHVDVENTSGIEDGSAEHPFNTIQEGLNAAQNGDSLSIAPGTYAEGRLLIEACIAISGYDRNATIVEGTFVLSTHLDSLPVSITRLWCRNVMHSDSVYTVTPLSIWDCGLQAFNDTTPGVQAPASVFFHGNIVTDSICVSNQTCRAPREITGNETGGGLWVGAASSQGNIRVDGNDVQGSVKVITLSKSDTVFVTNNTIGDSLVVTATSSNDLNVMCGNSIGHGARIWGSSCEGFQMRDNQLLNGTLTAWFQSLATSDVTNNDFLNGGIDFTATSATGFVAEGNRIWTDGLASGIRLQTTSGGQAISNTITLPYVPPTGVPFEADTNAVCGIYVNSVSYKGTRGNTVRGGSYAVYEQAVSAKDISNNSVSGSHYGVYLAASSARVDSNTIESCIADGLVLAAFEDIENSIKVNHNTIRNNGGHGIWTKGGLSMGSVDDPTTGFNILKTNGGYDLYVETPATFVDTIWAQNNSWTHGTDGGVASFDIYDASDDPVRARVIFIPTLILNVEEDMLPVPEDLFRISPNPTDGLFTIEASRESNPVSLIELRDMGGRVVAILSIQEPFSGIIEFDISRIPAGVYSVRCLPGSLLHTRSTILIKR